MRVMICCSFMLSAFMIIPSCTKKMAPIDSSVKSYFIIGSGGGVSGQYIQYKVYQTGMVEWYNFELTKYVPYSTLSSKMTAEIWNQLEQLHLQQIILDDPGNFTYYIELIKDGSNHKLKWSDESINRPPALHQFFTQVEYKLKNLK